MVQVARQNTQTVSVSAPVNGIIATGAYIGAGSTPQTLTGVESAIWMYNMIPGEFGCRVRPGSRELVTNLPDSFGPNGEVRTLVFYNSVQTGTGADRVFAVTDLGVYDVTAGGDGGAGWVPVLAWPSPGGDAGWCSYINYTNVGGDQFILLCDEANGYYIFDGVTWAAGTFTGSPAPVASALAQIVEWNGRIYLVERDSARVWFLDPLALSGDITPIDVGNRFKAGGHLTQCATWTTDAGDGIGDKLVMASSGGDILVWAGTDPADPTKIVLEGRWSVGSMPEGRRGMSDWGGDVAILSAAGLITISTLLKGEADISSGSYVSRNINQYIRTEMLRLLDVYGWSLEIFPKQNLAVITVPRVDTAAPIQFVLDLTTNAWCFFRDLDMVCQLKRGQDLLFGTSNGRVMILDATGDDVSLAGATVQTIKYSLLTHYDRMGQAVYWKRGMFIRPYWVGASRPSFQIQIRYDFDISEIGSGSSVAGAPGIGAASPAVWDTAIWGSDDWAGLSQSYLDTIGVFGQGHHAAIALRGETTAELSYLGADVMFDVGGML